MGRQTRVLEIETCGGCGRRLHVASYRSDFPSANVPDKSITWIVTENLPAHALHCTCSHYTVFSALGRQRD